MERLAYDLAYLPTAQVDHVPEEHQKATEHLVRCERLHGVVRHVFGLHAERRGEDLLCLEKQEEEPQAEAQIGGEQEAEADHAEVRPDHERAHGAPRPHREELIQGQVYRQSGHRREVAAQKVQAVDDYRYREPYPHEPVPEEGICRRRDGIGAQHVNGKLDEREGQLLLVNPLSPQYRRQADPHEEKGEGKDRPHEQRPYPNRPRDRLVRVYALVELLHRRLLRPACGIERHEPWLNISEEYRIPPVFGSCEVIHAGDRRDQVCRKPERGNQRADEHDYVHGHQLGVGETGTR